MMGRQRTICDSFWRDPKLANLTQEDKATLLYLLTGPSSNMIGVYPVVPRICAAEMGWTADQFTLVLHRLVGLGLIRYDDDINWLWVQVWWDHNNSNQVLGQKLVERTCSQVSSIPASWKKDWLEEFTRICPSFKDKVSAAGDMVSTRVSPSNVTQRIPNSNLIASQGKSSRPFSNFDGPGYRKFSESFETLYGGPAK